MMGFVTGILTGDLTWFVGVFGIIWHHKYEHIIDFGFDWDTVFNGHTSSDFVGDMIFGCV